MRIVVQQLNIMILIQSLLIVFTSNVKVTKVCNSKNIVEADACNETAVLFIFSPHCCALCFSFVHRAIFHP